MTPYGRISKRTGKPIVICEGCGEPKKRCQCLERELSQHIMGANLPEPEREYVFAPPRKYRADLYFPDARLVVEIEGGVYGKGGHSTGAGITRDIEKSNLLTILGYRLIRCSGEHVHSGQCLAWIEQALGVEAA